jgi:hypothetical protein
MDAHARQDAHVAEDTTPEAHAAQTEIYRRMTGEERLQIVFRLNHLARATAASGIRSRHPDYTEDQVRLALFRLLLGDDELTRRVWPDQPLVAP